MVVDATALTAVQQQDLFFRDPLRDPALPGTFGTLYLLRRDLNDMRTAMPNSALWPRAMAVMAGIDLLAKFFANSDAQNGVSRRFRDLLAKFITRDNNAASANNQALFQFRNSLLHSFGWYSVGPRNTVYRFRLTQSQQNWLVRQDPNNRENWMVNLTQLELDFERAISDYQAEVTAGTLQFPTGNNIFENYGWMEIS